MKLPDKAKTAMSIVAAADYRLSYKEGTKVRFQRRMEKNRQRTVFGQPTVYHYQKDEKKSEREVDLKPLVYAFSVEEEQGRSAFFLQVSTGSVDNINRNWYFIGLSALRTGIL